MMKTYLAVYTGSPQTKENSEWNSLPPEKRKELETKGMQAWGLWMDTHIDSIVVTGAPLGKTKAVNKDGVTNITNNLCGYVVVKATSHDEATKMFVGHPHFFIFPGDAVEIMECLEIPT